MLWTLQSYIFREMSKTYLLTALALMVVLGLGGGLMNMIELDQVTAWQMLKLMGIVLPVALALTLPTAALFAAATTYGRLSADNEFVACRSGGINILTLFAPSVLISLVSAAITFGFINFVIPGLIGNLNALVRSDLEQIVVHGIKAPGGFPLVKDRYRLFAGRAAVETALDDPAKKWVQLDGIVFMETEGDDWARFGSAQTVTLRFDTQRDDPTVTADMYNVNVFDPHKRQSAEFKTHQQLGPHAIPRRFGMKVKWLDLTELLYYRRHPDEWSEVRDQYERIRVLACGLKFYTRVLEEFPIAGRVRLGDEPVTYQLRADQANQDPTDGRIHFEGRVEIVETSAKGRRTITSDRAVLLAEAGGDPANARASLEVFDNVTLSDPADPSQTIKKPRLKLDPFQIDPQIVAEVTGPSGAALLHDPALFPLGSVAARKRDAALGKRDEVLREIDGVAHARFAFSASVFVLVILAAALGIMFRGAHVLTAFGIAFVPAAFVIVTIVAGRHLAEKTDTAVGGLALLWSGIAVVGALDAWVLLKALRR